MTRDAAGAQRSPLSPLRAHGGGRRGGAAPDAVGSSTKDTGWRQRRGSENQVSRLQNEQGPRSEKKKKVEGMVVAAAAAPVSRVAAPGSRIPRAPLAPAAAGPRPAAQCRRVAWADAAGAAAPPSGFQAYTNPSFDCGGQVTPPGSSSSSGEAPGAAPAGIAAAGSAPRMYVNGLAEVEAEAAGQAALTPGMLDPAALTPASERSLHAWLCAASPAASTAGVAGAVQQSARPAPGQSRIPAPASTAGKAASGGSKVVVGEGKGLPTPEAWCLLQHINEDSPAAAPQGVRGIMNAYLRTGPQQLSPEPSDMGMVIRAPGAAAVPATGLLNVAGPGGAGVYGMMNALMRTGAHQLSPEPGMEGVAPAGEGAPAQPLPVLHPYSPASPLACTPAAGPPPATGAAAASGAAPQRPISPSSVCSNGAVDSSGEPASSISLGGGDQPGLLPQRAVGAAAAVASVPRLNLAAVHRRHGTSEGAEISLGAGLAAAGQQGRQPAPESPGAGSPPTARLSPASAGPAAEAQGLGREEGALACGAAHRRGPPSPITFRLPGDSPGQEQQQRPASESPSFSFGNGGPAAMAAACPAPAADSTDAAVAAGVDAADQPAASLPRIDSGESVQQPHPFKAMLQHLRGPQYASPARFVRFAGTAGSGEESARADSPQSPKECTPLHLISASDMMLEHSPVRPGSALMVTPAPGQGSLTVWMDRRGMRGGLSTPARNDLRLLWAAAREVMACRSEAAVLRAQNAALHEELTATQAALRDLGAEHGAAVVAAEAGALCAEAEAARARDAARHMASLADQIQGMFALCEEEKQSLVAELEAARVRLAESEAAAVGATQLSTQAQSELQAQLEEARAAVNAAQGAADAAQRRASDAAQELAAIRCQLAEAQLQLDAQVAAAKQAAAPAQQQAEQDASAQPQAPPSLTPMSKLRQQLGAVHDSLAQLHAEHSAGRLHAPTPELEQLLSASRGQLAHVEELLGGGAAELRRENERLQRCLAEARSKLAERTPALASAGGGGAVLAGAAPGGGGAGGTEEQEHSPPHFMLFGHSGFTSGSEFEGEAASPDVFSSPYMASASQATLTVDYRELSAGVVSSAKQAGDASASCATSSTGSQGGASPCWPRAAEPLEGSPDHDVAQGLGAAQHGSQQPAGQAQQGGQQEEEFTVVHNGMVITHVPASEVSKVRSMVEWWEAVASGTPLPAAVSAEDAAAAEAYAAAAVAAAEAALAEQAAAAGLVAEEVEQAAADEQAAAWTEQATVEVQAEAVADAEEAVAPASAVAAEVQQDGAEAAEAAAVVAGSSSWQPACSPAGDPVRLASRLPAGIDKTPASLPAAARVEAFTSTPARYTPSSFAAPPPTPADGVSHEQVQQLAASMAAAAVATTAATAASTPASEQRTLSRLPATPVGTPAGGSLAVAVTPLALSVLRARMAGSAAGAQDAVRDRLARLKADLAAAQAKLAHVDQGLASIALTPTSSASNGSTPGSRRSSLLHRGQALAVQPTAAGALGSPISAAGGSPDALGELSLGSSRAAALIAAGGASPLAPPGRATSSVVSAMPRWPAQEAAQHTVQPLSSPAPPAAPTPGGEAAEGQDSAAIPAAAAAADEYTPAVTRRSVRFADTVQDGSGNAGRAHLRMGTPYMSAAALASEVDEAVPTCASPTASPVVASCMPAHRRSQLGRPAGTSPLAAAVPQRSPLAPMQSAAKPAAGSAGAPVRHFVLGPGDSSDSSDDDSQLLYDASRMAQRANRAATPTPSPMHPLAGGAAASPTPMAHPERAGQRDEDGEGRGSYDAGEGAGRMGRAMAAAATPATSVLSTSSFSPPQQLLLLAVRPLGRGRRGGFGNGLLRGAGLRGEAEEREFRRRAAALNIQISPYFHAARRSSSAGNDD